MLTSGVSIRAAVPEVQIIRSSTSALPAGTPVTWTAATPNRPRGGRGNVLTENIRYQYRWQIVQNGAEVVFRDYNTTTSITWAPTDEDPYTVSLEARNPVTLEAFTARTTVTPASLLPAGSQAVVTPVNHPLVAIYSAACQPGSSVRVLFAPAGSTAESAMATPPKICGGNARVNLVVAGMRAQTTYEMHHEVTSGSGTITGPTISFTTGAIPDAIKSVLPTMTVSGTSTALERVLLESFIGTNIMPAAYDATGQVIWYNYPAASGGVDQLLRPLAGGTMVVAQGDVVEEIDLLGNIIHETNITRMGEQLSAPPFNALEAGVSRIADFDHDAIRLPDGSIATLSVIEKVADQGDGRGAIDVLGALILVLDEHWQLAWAWNAFAHLDVTRKATLGDTCASFELGCPVLSLAPPGYEASDWLHANSLAYTDDGNLLLSLRNQDWVIKIDYKNRTGGVLWRFGQGGDFVASGDSTEPVLFPSHQHYVSLSGSRLMLFDNANATNEELGGSRGQVWSIDEPAKTAHLDIDARMNTFSFIVGTAELLGNGNLYFLSGFLDNGARSQSIEFNSTAPLATPAVTFTVDHPAYRSFRTKDLYTP